MGSKPTGTPLTTMKISNAATSGAKKMKSFKKKSLSILLAGSAFGLAGCPAPVVVKPTEPLTTNVVKAPVEASPEENEYAGFTAFKAKDYAAAKEKFAKALAKNPKLIVANYDSAFIAQSEGNLDAAAAGYEAVLAQDPDHEGAILNLGKVYRDQNQLDKGIALYEAAVAKKPFDVKMLGNLTVFYRVGKKYDKATQTVRKLLSRTKDNPDAYKNLALIAYDQGQLRLAEFIGANAKKLDKEDPAVYNNLGLVYMKLGEPRRALANFKTAVEKKKDFAPGHANIGAMALSYRDYDTAAKSFEQVTKLEPSSWTAHLNLAWSYEGQRTKEGTHRSKDAVAEFESVLKIVKDQPEAIYGMARAYAGELKDLAKAKESYERYLKVPDGKDKEKATKELAVVDQRIKSASDMEEMKKKAAAEAVELAEKKKKEDAQKRAKELDAKGGSVFDKATGDAEKAAPQDQTPADPNAPKKDDPAAPAPNGTEAPKAPEKSAEPAAKPDTAAPPAVPVPGGAAPAAAVAAPKDAVGFVVLAKMSFEKGEKDKAKTAVEAALKLDPNNADAKELQKKLEAPAAPAAPEGKDKSAEVAKP